MSIYIEGLEMPRNEPMLVKINPDGSVSTTAKNGYRKYEAIPVPNHGDLIERDAIHDSFKKNPYSKDDLFMSVGLAAKTMRTVNSMFALFRKTLQDAPTIIPADKEDESKNVER